MLCLLATLLAPAAWPRALPLPQAPEPRLPALEQPQAAARRADALLLEDLKAKASLSREHFGPHHLVDRDPDTCWIGGADAASWTLTIALGDVYRLERLALDAYPGLGAAAVDVAYSLDSKRYEPLGQLSPAGSLRLGGAVATHVRLVLRGAEQGVPVLCELRLFGR